jgi:ferredoxin-thioredoxin reductase catalytic subunit
MNLPMIPDGMKYNPNAKTASLILKGLEKKEGYCPCEIEKSPDTLCPCKQARENQICRCGLYVKANP